jgi:glycyl-tRNA synthetase beta chain
MMAALSPLLVEVLSEELPPKSLKRLGEVFAQTMVDTLREAGLVDADAPMRMFATPRRLGVYIENVASQAPDRAINERLMPVKVGWVDGQAGVASAALIKKLQNLYHKDVDIADILTRVTVESDGKQDVLVHRSTARGATIAQAIGPAIADALAALPIAKVMSYQLADGVTDVKFVRPVHGIVALYGNTLLDVEMLGVTTGCTTLGHRFLATQTPLTITTADQYETQLHHDGRVIASFAKRRAAIVEGLQKAAAGAHVIAPEALLDEVTALVEWPVVYAGTFDAAFLQVPQECLILTMQLNQKYFALADKPLAEGGRLTNRFLLVSNIATDKPQAIIGGNERVLRARLADAKFFFDVDRKQSLESRLPKLAAVVYHNKLGSQLERVERLGVQAALIADRIGAASKDARRAGRLAKADLVTDMVGEFPELQGLMGRYYAQHDGEPAVVAKAIEQHYRPRFAGDVLPDSGVGQAVALADKLDTLVGIFGVGHKPTGDKDPFGLRRAALGVIRILVETPLSVDIVDLIDHVAATFQAGLVATTRDDVLEFLYDRLRFWLKEQGFDTNEVEAVVGQQPRRFDVVPAKLQAVQAFMALPEAVSLAAANKRVQNILKKSGSAQGIDSARLLEPAEVALAAEVSAVWPKVQAKLVADDYTEALRLLSSLRGPVDAFFNDVMVNVDDEALRRNRLALLSELARVLNAVADISRLVA